MSRGDLTEPFRASVRHASTELSCHVRVAPEYMAYNKSARTYDRGSEFKPRSLEPSVLALTPMRGVKAKHALLYCALRRPGLEVAPSARKPPDQQIALLFREVVDADYR